MYLVVTFENSSFASYKSKTTDAGLANNILSVLHENGIDTNITKLVGQGYDGASSMSDEFRGVCISRILLPYMCTVRLI